MGFEFWEDTGASFCSEPPLGTTYAFCSPKQGNIFVPQVPATPLAKCYKVMERAAEANPAWSRAATDGRRRQAEHLNPAHASYRDHCSRLPVKRDR